MKTGDSDKIIAAALKAKEQAGTIMSGGKMTQAQANMLHDLESTADQLQAKIGKFTGNPTAGAGAVSRLSQLIDDAGHETLAQISDIRNRSMKAMLRPGGAADTPEKKRAFLNRNAGLFSEVKWRGKPAFDEGKNPVPTLGPVDEGAKATPAVAPESMTPQQKMQALIAVRNDPVKFNRLSSGQQDQLKRTLGEIR